MNINDVLNVMHRYIQITLYILGVCGGILNIFTFLQKQLRSHSCSMYFLASSFCDLWICHTFILLNIISLFDHQDYIQFFNTSSWCKFDRFSAFMFPCLSAFYILMASVDRFCASSRKVAWRKFSTTRVSRIVVLGIFLIWTLFSLHIVIAFDWRALQPNDTDLYCSPPLEVYTFFVIVDGYFFALFNGIIVPFLLAVFGVLIIFHVRQTQRRRAVVVPIAPAPPVGQNSSPTTKSKAPMTSIDREKRHLITMLLMQVFVTIGTTLPYIIVYLNNLYGTIPVTEEYLLSIRVIGWFWYLNFCKAFYVNTLSSQFYRSILKKQVFQLFHRWQALH